MASVSEEERLKIFEGAAREFYETALNSDKEEFIDYAKKIIIADHKITKRENMYINKLFDLWGMQ